MFFSVIRPLLVVAQHELGGAAPFPQLVPESIAAERGEPDFLAEFLRGMAAHLQADAFRFVEGQRPFPGAVADADVRILQVAGGQHVPDGGEPFEGTPFLEALHGGEDGLFPGRQVLGADIGPPGFVLVGRFAHFHLVAACHLLRAREGTRLEGCILQVTVHLDGNDGHPVVQMGRDVQEHLFVVEEPGPVLPAGVVAVHVQVPDPVDIGGGGQPAMDGMDGVVLRVDLHPALEGRGRDQLLREEGDGIGLPAREGQGVHEAVMIE